MYNVYVCICTCTCVFVCVQTVVAQLAVQSKDSESGEPHSCHPIPPHALSGHVLCIRDNFREDLKQCVALHVHVLYSGSNLPYLGNSF